MTNTQYVVYTICHSEPKAKNLTQNNVNLIPVGNDLCVVPQGFCRFLQLLGRFVNRPYRGCGSPLVCADFRGRARRPAPTRCRERPSCRSKKFQQIFCGRFVNRPYRGCGSPLGCADFAGEHSSPLRPPLRLTCRIHQNTYKTPAQQKLCGHCLLLLFLFFLLAFDDL